jgi:hypothetical protein
MVLFLQIMTADVDCVAIKRVNAGQEIVVENMCLQRQVELHEKWRGISLQSAFARHNTGATLRIFVLDVLFASDSSDNFRLQQERNFNFYTSKFLQK